VKTLLDHGADPTSKDPEFRATPLQWAEFLHRERVAAFLAGLTQSGGPGAP
jgi:hypothetical protein